MNEKADFAVKIIRQYANECGTLPRGTSDLSPMEEWLILRLFAVINQVCDCNELEQMGELPMMKCRKCGKYSVEQTCL